MKSRFKKRSLGIVLSLIAVLVLPITSNLVPVAYGAETADWLPFKLGNGVVEIGCTWSPNGCGLPNHTDAQKGIDFIVPVGTPVYAPGPGTVVAASNCSCDTRGKYAEIAHPDGRRSRYLHMSSVTRSAGNAVNRGDLIGYSGDTMANGVPHLHYDEWIGGTKVDPGSMKARHGSNIVQYPNQFGYTSWNQVPAWSDKFVYNDSYDAPAPPAWNGVGNAVFAGSDRLEPGEKLFPNQYLLSEDGRFVLMLQTDGNLVLYTYGRTLWWSGTSGPASHAIMQEDGNFVVYRPDGSTNWHSHTGGEGLSTFVVQHDGNIVLYDTNLQATWVSGSYQGGTGWINDRADKLNTEDRLYASHFLQSPDKRYVLVLQEDGNLVLYAPGYTPIWNAGTAGRPVRFLHMQSDGNLVLYGDGNQHFWHSATQGGPSRLNVQSDGNLVVYNLVTWTWQSGTAGRL